MKSLSSRCDANSMNPFFRNHDRISNWAVSLLVLALLFVGPRELTAAEPKLVLVGKEISPVPIIVFPDAPPKTRKAADELADYIEKISGARPEVIEGEPEKMPEHAIWVGYQPKLKELFPKLDFDFKNPEEILIAANENHLVIAGRDRWDKDHMTLPAPWGKGEISDLQQEYGTANAVYTFIQQDLDVRWFWPGPIGEDVIKNETIAFAPFEYRYHPQFRARSTLFRLSALGDGRGHSHEWTRLQRLQLDSLNVAGGHAFTQWWGRFHQTHPEYFALQPDGTRSLSAFGTSSADVVRAPGLAKLCISNPKVQDQWIADVKEALKINPYQTVFSALENDSFNRGVCVCENCRAWDAPGNKTMTRMKGDTVLVEHLLTDRYVHFWNILARRLKKEFPDQQLYVLGGAYGNYRPVPFVEKPDANVLMIVVANACIAAPQMRKESSQDMKNWGELGPIIWRPNLWTRAGRWGLPEISMKNQEGIFRLVAESNGIGVYFDTIWEHWATHGPMLYLLAQLTWNPRLDADQIMAEYYRRGFGPAADEVRKYWEGMDTLMDNPIGQPIGLSDEFLNKSDQLLAGAAAKVAKGPQIYRDRVEFVRDGLTYTRLMLDFLKLQYALIEEGTYSPEANPQVEAEWKKIEAWCKNHPEYAINARFISRAKEGPQMSSRKSVRNQLDYLSNLWKSDAGKNYKGQPVDLNIP